MAKVSESQKNIKIKIKNNNVYIVIGLMHGNL